jgi:hypothetical protein
MIFGAAAAMAAVMAVPRLAAACPGCHAAVAARSAFREDPNLWFYAVVTVVPFVLVAILALRLHQVGRPSLTAQVNPIDRQTAPREKRA